MDMFDLASQLFGNRANSVAQGPSVTATGSTASADGIAGIVFDGDVTPAEGIGGEDADQTVIDLPTSPDVAEGDEVIVTLVGDGPLKTPIVTANPGSGDRMAAAVQDAHDLAASVESIAQEAKEVAEATGQHFWPDDDGVHVTEVTQDEWSDSEGASYHSGANVLINALGQLFRDGLNNILAIVSGTDPGVAIYDGTGNDAENVLAEFTADHVRIGGSIDGVGHSEATIGFFGGDVDTETTYIDAAHDVGTSLNTSNVETVSRDIRIGNIVTDSGLWEQQGRVANGFLSFTQEIMDYGSEQGQTSSEYSQSYVSLYSGTENYNYAALTLTAENDVPSVGTSDEFTSISARADRVVLESDSGAATIPMEQVVCSLRRPFAMFRGASSSTTATATGWRLTSFDTVMSNSGNHGEYFTFSGGVLTALKNIRVEISGCMSWTDSVAGIRGFGVRHNSSTATGGTEYSEFQHFPSDVTSRKSVWMAGLVLNVAAGVKCAICRYEQTGAVYVNGINFSRIEIKVLGVY